MKKIIIAASVVTVLLIGGAVAYYLLKPEKKEVAITVEPIPEFQLKIPNALPATSVIVELNDPAGTPDDDVRILHFLAINFLTAVKEPYRPPLGLNEDFVKAFTGGNRYGDEFISDKHPTIKDGQIVDRWGTPYHFHPRAPGAIDVRSAGPDKVLFTDDDVTAGGSGQQVTENMLSKNS